MAASFQIHPYDVDYPTLVAGAALEIAVLVRVILRPHRE
jgi:hypothetical protein